MAQLIGKMGKIYTYLFDELGDSRNRHFPMMSCPLPVILIVACYVFFVTSLGPRLMKHRKPFQIDGLVQVYDVIQVGLSLWTTYECCTLCWFLDYNFFCEPINYSYDPIPLRIARLGYVAFLIKLFDFVDTVIFVLRKKNNQITFLHVYHHVMMAFAYWFGVKYVAGGSGTMVPFINSIVHAVMYSYYLMTSLYPEQKKNMWWKKHITQMQLAQFLFLTVHNAIVLFQPNCAYPKFVSAIYLPQSVFMFFMFYNFYKKAYLKQTKTNEMLTQEKNK